MKKLILASLLIFLPHFAHAIEYCKCSERQLTPLEKFSSSYAVFTGTVERISREVNPDRIKVTFNIHDSWKGIRNDKASVYTDASDPITTMRTGNITCGYNFQQGATYLIYSDRNKNAKGPSWVSSCGDVIPISEATSDIQFLDSVEKIELRNRR